MPREVIKFSDLDVTGQRYGWVIETGAAHIYQEDGDVGNWLFKFTVDPLFLGDFHHGAMTARKLHLDKTGQESPPILRD